jgi:hypothetical protein
MSPNESSGEVKCSWIEPVIGSRQEWKKDRWRFVKIGACLLVVLVVSYFVWGSFNRAYLECFGAVTVFIYAYLWLLTFFPRRIVLSDGYISIFRGGARGTTPSIKVDCLDIKKMEVFPDRGRYLIRLTKASNDTMDLYATNKSVVDMLDTALSNNSKKVN